MDSLQSKKSGLALTLTANGSLVDVLLKMQYNRYFNNAIGATLCKQ